MAEKIGVPLSALAASGLSGARFAKEYTDLSGHLEKRLKMFNTLRVGQIILEAGLGNLLPLVDSPAFEQADTAQRQKMIMMFLGALHEGDFARTASAIQTSQERPPAPQQVVKPAPEPQPDPEPNPAPAAPQPPAAVNNEPEIKDGPITKTEPAPVGKPNLPRMGKMIDSR